MSDRTPLAHEGLAGLKRGFSSLENRNFRLYLSGQVVSRIGTWMQQVSLPWLVLALGGSPIELGIASALEFVPSTILTPFGGVFADRIDKRRAMMVTQSAAMLQVCALFALTVTGVITIPMIFALALVVGTINAVDSPLRQSLAAELVPPSTLTNAIALNSMAFNSARVVGPAVAGVTIALGTALFGSTTSGVAFNFALNAVSYVAVIVNVWRMDPAKIRRPIVPERQPRVLKSLQEGIRYAWRTPLVLWALVLLLISSTFAINFPILLPLFAKGVLGLDASGYGALYATMGIGSLAGALTLAFMHERRAVMLMIGGGLLFSCMELGLAFVRTPLMAVPLIVGVGFFSMLMINTINATVQANVPDALRGRVMALYVTVFQGSTPIGAMFAGFLAEHWGVPTAFAVGALLSLGAVALAGWRFRVSRQNGRLGHTRLGVGERYEEAREQETPLSA
jgi:MFS family permease